MSGAKTMTEEEANKNGENKTETKAGQDSSADIEKQLEEKTREAQDFQDRYLRTYAELENYKKRVAKDQEDLIKYSNEKLLKEILPVVDNLERAIFHAREAKQDAKDADKDQDKILEGLGLILKQFLEALSKFGAVPFDSRLKPFDPTVHQALGQMPSDEHEEGMVVEEIQKGYFLNDRVLRPALVMVSKRKEEPGQ